MNLKDAESGWITRLFTPLTTTILAGILTLAASAIGTLLQGRSTLELERQKFQANREIESRKEQHELILKMVSVGDELQARANLRFLAEAKLIDGTLATSILALKDFPVLPPPNSSAPSNSEAFQAVQTDDDGINLVVSWEGGFMLDAENNSATNAGITLSGLSSYLGRQATLAELKSLPQDSIRDFYRKKLAPASGISLPMVRTAFLNLAVWGGERSAMKLFQAATEKITRIKVEQDGYLGPSNISLINSVNDADSLVETADCLWIDKLKETAAWINFKQHWLARLRAFSPVTLHAVCPELQNVSVNSNATNE